MISANDYRSIAEECMRHASGQDDSSMPLWATMAKSWLQLAAQAEEAEGISIASEGEVFEADDYSPAG